MKFDYEEWRQSTNKLTAHLVSDFERRNGYPPGRNTAAPATVPLSREAVDALPAPLAEFYRHVAEVTLGDLRVGYFIQTAQETLDSNAGRPVKLDGPETIEVITFGSDGGGTLFALGLPNGEPVYRLPASGIDHNGVYDNTDYRAHVTAATLPEFLTELHTALRETSTARACDLDAG